MSRPREVRTFVRLQKAELDFLHTLQRLVQKKLRLKRPPPMHRIIQGLVLDYRKVIEVGANPELLQAYEEAGVRRRTPGRGR